MSDRLEQFARRVETEPFFLASALAEYARGEHSDERALAEALGCSLDALTRLRLCRRPRAEPRFFQQDLDQIATRFGVRADVLAQLVRRADALRAMRRASAPQAGLLIAARDHEEAKSGLEPGAGQEVTVSTPLWVSETAEAFWADAGGAPPVPRDLRAPIARALPLATVLLPRLRVSSADIWLHQQGIQCGLSVRDRPLRGCLVARYGQGLIFVDGADPEDEQRFSLTHELAHFLRDYWRPRQLVRERLGWEVLDVLDGERPPRQEERVHALLAKVQIGFHVHLMARTPDGHLAETAVEKSEREADRLAFELLAPAAMVLHGTRLVPSEGRRKAVFRLLKGTFGLPTAPAAQYASLLVPPTSQESSLLRRLRLLP